MNEISALSVASLTYAYGSPLTSGTIRARPEDFMVREYLGFEPSGAGEHLLLVVRKRGANTKWVARQLAARAGLRARDIGFAGLKDRHAVTEQAFTLLANKSTPESWLGFSGEGFEVIAAHRQLRKIRRGAHRGNDFEIIIRDVEVESTLLEQRLTQIAKQGVPNYFGAQRFGRNESNLVVAERWFSQGQPPQDRDQRGFALSATRSALFNAVLSQRVIDGTWNKLLPGEIVNLNGTGSVFACDTPDAILDERCERLDIHPTGPLVGVGESRVKDKALEIEEQVLTPWSKWRDSLIELNVEAHRRALRLAVEQLQWQYQDKVLTLRFRLTRGAFATAVLRELIATEAQEESEDQD